MISGKTEGLPGALTQGRPSYFPNPFKVPFKKAADAGPGCERIAEASARLERFAPFIARAFPETEADGGLIESPLREAAGFRASFSSPPPGRLFIKLDSELPVAGSVKARGGIYEVLQVTEDEALRHSLIKPGDNYAALCDHKSFFSRYSMQVGSTGNLGLSIGLAAAAIGYKTTVHMSADAKKWKKEKLRANGVEVKEYSGDYGEAVRAGRELSDADPFSHFVDDERSEDLFLGYATAGERLAKQLRENSVAVDEAHPLCVYLPCGVGGAPGGITYGLKHIYGDSVRVYFVEPVTCPCVTLGILSGEDEKISVRDVGLSGTTEADGLAVARPSGLVCRSVRQLVDGFFTVEDGALLGYLRRLFDTEGIFIEPSSCVAADAWARNVFEKNENATHVIWATGGSLVPDEIKKKLTGRCEP